MDKTFTVDQFSSVFLLKLMVKIKSFSESERFAEADYKKLFSLSSIVIRAK